MSLLRRFAPLLVSVALVGALGAVGLQASAGANGKAETMHRRDREVLQTTLAGLGKQYTLFAFKEEMDFAWTGRWPRRPGDKADVARLQDFVNGSAVLNYGAALVALDKTPINAYATDPAGLPPASDAGYTPLVQGLLAQQPGLSSVMHAGNVPLVGLGVPVMINGQAKAVLVAYFRADKSALQTYVEQLRYGKTGQGLLLDSTGVAVAAGDRSLVGHKVDSPDALQAISTQRTGFLEAKVNGTTMAVSDAPLGLGGWTSVTQQSAAEFYGPLKSGRNLIDLSIVAVLAVAALGLAVLSYRRQVAVRRSEERFQSLARNAFELVTVTDAKGAILYESPALERVLGYKADERLG